MGSCQIDKICFAAGGSGGHLFPAIQMARDCEKKGMQPIFCGVGLQDNLFFLQTEYPYKSIQGSTWRKQTFFLDFWKILKGTWQAFQFFQKEKPNLVIGFGSYHSFPVVLCAYLMRIPYVLFEPNLSMGKVNALFQSNAKKIFTYFCDHGKNKRKIFPLIQIKKELTPKSFPLLNREIEKKMILIFGGSQGSVFINTCMKWVDPKFLSRYQIIHIVGMKNCADELQQFYHENKIEAVVLPFFHDLHQLYLQADFCIVRAGASTLMECLHYGVPALFIPYGEDENGHQYVNARYFETVIKGGITLSQKNLSPELMNSAISEMGRQADQFRLHLKQIKDQEKRTHFIEEIEEILNG